MIFTIRGDEKMPFSVFPEDENAEIIQNVRLLITSDRYNIPLAREMGKNLDPIGERIQIAKMREYQNILDLIEEYEPRAKVIRLDFDIDSDQGKLIPILEVETSV